MTVLVLLAICGSQRENAFPHSDGVGHRYCCYAYRMSWRGLYVLAFRDPDNIQLEFFALPAA